jgi:hypothetical protein
VKSIYVSSKLDINYIENSKDRNNVRSQS